MLNIVMSSKSKRDMCFHNFSGVFPFFLHANDRTRDVAKLHPFFQIVLLLAYFYNQSHT